MSEVDHVLQYLYAGEDPSAEMAQRTILLTAVTLRAEAQLIVVGTLSDAF